jgi:hypothetical protein
VAQPALGRVADVNGYMASSLVSAGIEVVALPFVLLARREQAASDPITGDLELEAPPTAARATGSLPLKHVRD